MRRTRRGRSEKIPCVIAALNDCGFVATMETTDSTEIRRLCLEIAKAEHSRAEDSRRKECKKQVKLSFKGGLTQRTFRRLMIQKNTLLGTAVQLGAIVWQSTLQIKSI